MLMRLRRSCCVLRPLSMLQTIQPAHTMSITPHIDPHPVHNCRAMALWSKRIDENEAEDSRGILLYRDPPKDERVRPALIWTSLPAICLGIPIKYIDNVMLYGSTWDLKKFTKISVLCAVGWIFAYVEMSKSQGRRLVELRYLPKTRQIAFKTMNHYGRTSQLHGPFDPSVLYLDRDVKSKEKGGQVYLRQRVSSHWTPGLISSLSHVKLIVKDDHNLYDPERFTQLFPKSDAYLELEQKEKDEAAAAKSTEEGLDSPAETEKKPAKRMFNIIEIDHSKPETVSERQNRINRKKPVKKDESTIKRTKWHFFKQT